MNTSKSQQRGYSLAELLTVIAIISVMSLVTVPAFINYAKSSRLKNSMRQFTSDLRAARHVAVSRSMWTRLEVTTASPSPGTYTLSRSTDRGTTFGMTRDEQRIWRISDADVSTDALERRLEQTNKFDATGTITFLPNGTAQFSGGGTSLTLKVQSDDPNLNKEFSVTINNAGKISAQ